jgi:hypothetical protein
MPGGRGRALRARHKDQVHAIAARHERRAGCIVILLSTRPTLAAPLNLIQALRVRTRAPA